MLNNYKQYTNLRDANLKTCSTLNVDTHCVISSTLDDIAAEFSCSYIYKIMCVCVCVCVCDALNDALNDRGS